MEEVKNKSKVYEVEFEKLVEGEKEAINIADDVMNAQMEITVSIGSTREKIEKIVSLKVGDIIELDKQLEENLDINVNGKPIAGGESIILDNKLAVRLSNIIETEKDNN